MTRAAALALAAALAAGGAACDKTRPVEQPTADVAECSRCHGNPPPAFIAGGTEHPTSTRCSACHPGTVEADDVTIVLGGLHMNGVVDAVGASHALPFVADHAAAALDGIGACRACHGETLGGGTATTSCNACHAGIAASGPDWKTNCTFCHGTRTAGVTTATREAAPPQAVSAGGDQTRTNPKVGAHQAHLAQGSVSNALPCSSCHAVPAPAQALTHFTGGSAAVTFDALATKGVTGAAYAGGTCNVYCHGAGTEFPNTAVTASPAWTSTGVGCTTCHGMPPPSGPDVSGQTAHAFHVTGQGVGCATCHPVPPGQLAAHVNGAKDVVVQPSGGGTQAISGWDCTACHGALGVALSHALPYLAQHASAAISSLSSCTACHGATYGGGTAQSCNACHAGIASSGPDWKTNCTFCHGTRTAGVTTGTAAAAPPQTVAGSGDQTAANPKVGAHQTHAGNGSTFSAGFACTQCHPAATDLSHVGGSGAAQLAWGTLATDGGTVPASMTSGTCANYCHGVSLDGGPAASPAWTSTAALSCQSCHGNPPSSHSAGSTDCNACHAGTVNANGTIDVAGGLHVNGEVEATSAHAADWGLPAQHGYTVNRTGLESCKGCHGTTLAGGSGRACADCHGTGWDTNCTFCHGNPSTGRASPPVDTQGRSVTSNVSVGVHASHVGTTWATPLACTECHPVRSASVITDASHIDGNGIGEVSFGALARTGGAPAAYNRASATSATCASTYCHGRFTGGVNAGAGATPSWTATTAATCASCHPSSPTSRRHGTHNNYACSECHGSGYTSSTVNAATHVNGTRNVPLTGISGAAYNPTSRSCGTFDCHGDKNHDSGDTW